MFPAPLTSVALLYGLLGAAQAVSLPGEKWSNLNMRSVALGPGEPLIPESCLPSRGLRNDEAGEAVNHLAYKSVPTEGYTMLAGTCIHHITGFTCAQVCNYTPNDRNVTQKEIFLTLAKLRMDCGAEELSGARQIGDLSAYIYGIDGGSSNSTESDASDTAARAKRSNGPESSYENGVLTIKMDQPPRTKEEFNALVADAMKQQGQDVNDLPESADLVKRGNPCEQSAPNFNGQSIWGCNRHPLGPGGICPFQGQNKDCASWCEVRRRFFYGMERPYSAEVITSGNGAPVRTLTKGYSVSWGLSFDVGLGLSAPDGIFSGSLGLSLSRTVTYTVEEGSQADPKDMHGFCGYFTFIPKMVESCGSLTKWRRQTVNGNHFSFDKCDGRASTGTTGNVCITHPFKRPDGKPDGLTIVVLIRCWNHHLLAPMRLQNIDYRRPGVADIGPHAHEQWHGEKK
ncbi:hypothetical protein TWF696_000103 [Orbilia brochopaga]|uniref:Uncharacterized protein n=1 Tax=Orbilia brochopaga TaxID=3140254 RepID=A0AAV9VAQ6_9PEZI